MGVLPCSSRRSLCVWKNKLLEEHKLNVGKGHFSVFIITQQLNFHKTQIRNETKEQNRTLITIHSEWWIDENWEKLYRINTCDSDCSDFCSVFRCSVCAFFPSLSISFFHSHFLLDSKLQTKLKNHLKCYFWRNLYARVQCAVCTEYHVRKIGCAITCYWFNGITVTMWMTS